MKYALLRSALFCLAIGASAETSPTLVFSGYIEYPARHDYRIEVFTYPTGLISRIVTLSGDPQMKSEEMTILKREDRISGVDQFQKNLRTFEMAIRGGEIHLVIANEDLDTRRKKQVTNTIRVRPGENILFDDDAKVFSLLPTGTLRIEAKAKKDDAIVVRENQIFDDGWYRADWKREGPRTTIREYTTMEVPGDWISDGGGVFTGATLNTDELITNIMNYYILDIYLGRLIFLPWIFGLKTGSY
jgi:hypothetical protein